MIPNRMSDPTTTPPARAGWVVRVIGAASAALFCAAAGAYALLRWLVAAADPTALVAALPAHYFGYLFWALLAVAYFAFFAAVIALVGARLYRRTATQH